MNIIINESVAALKAGKTLLYPTDTVWGIGCDATNEQAVAKIIALKQRDDKKSFIILLANTNDLGRYVKDIPEMAWSLIDYAEKPLTIIYPQATALLAKNAVNEDGSIAIRIVKDGFCYELIKQFRKPIISTSANISGFPSPTDFATIDPKVSSGVDYIAKIIADGTGEPSTILRLGINGEIDFLRK